jgi:hydrogenase expression/formation protein HypD
MEVCGTHTVASFRSGLRSLLPPAVTLLSGPGCPVCVTPTEVVDAAVGMARQPDTLVATFGDMIRVPGTEWSLERARAVGAKVQVVYSPEDALRKAERHAGVRVVFLGVGFETTAPAVAWTIREAAARGISNYLVLCAHKTMPRAMAALLSEGDVRIDGFLCPGHVSVITGSAMYGLIARDHGIPCVIAGFEGADMARAIEMVLAQILDRRAEVEIQYTRSVTAGGNPAAQGMIGEVFEPADAVWRGLGLIPASGLKIREAFARHDAARQFADLRLPPPAENPECACGDVLRGARVPSDCPLFSTRCTPRTPVGPCMVSSEGACAAYYKYRDRFSP